MTRGYHRRSSVRELEDAIHIIAVAKIAEHLDARLAFFDYPDEHVIHLRTTNPIETTFATVPLRQRLCWPANPP